MSSSIYDDEFLAELRIEFYDEARDSLNVCEKILLEYESNSQAECIKALMRALHSIKGSAKAVDLDKVAYIIHIHESACQKLGEGFVDTSFIVIDKLREALDCMADGDTAHSERILDETIAIFQSR